MKFRAARSSLMPFLALTLSAPMALAEAHGGAAEGIRPADSALADLLISLAELELGLTRNGAADLPPPPGEGPLLDRVTARLALLNAVEIAPVVPPSDTPEDEKLAGLPAPGAQAAAGPDSAAPDAEIDPIAAARDFSPGADAVPPPGPLTGPTDAPPAADSFVAVSLNGSSVHSLLLEDLSEADRAALPDATACADLGEWFLGLPLQRDFKSVFVIEGDYVRICRELGQTWRVKRATSRDRAHVVKRAD